MGASFQKLATVTCGTKRNPDPVSGIVTAPVTNLSGVKCLPLDPVSAEIATRLELDTPHEVLQTMIEGGEDIVEGDVLTVGSAEYNIRAVEDWTWRPDAEDTVLLILEELKDG